MRKLRTIVLLAASVIVLLFFALQVLTLFGVKSNGTIYDFDTTGYDPADPFRGRYLAFRMLPDSIPVDRVSDDLKDQHSRSEAYAQLEHGADGSVIVTSLQPNPPAEGDYLHCNYYRFYNDTYRIEWPFRRYYLNEDLAAQADRLRWNAEIKLQARLRIQGGQALLETLLVNGQPLEEYLRVQER